MNKHETVVSDSQTKARAQIDQQPLVKAKYKLLASVDGAGSPMLRPGQLICA